MLGYSVALAAMDQAAKNAEISIMSIDTNNPLEGDAAQIPNVFIVKFIGSISDVSTALGIARETALKYISEKDISTHQIHGNIEGLDLLIKKGKVLPGTGESK